MLPRAARRPADQRQVVDQRFRQVAFARNSATEVAPWRFDSGLWSGPITSARWAKRRRREAERLVQQQLPRRVRDVISPRTTCVTSISASSTTTAKLWAGCAVGAEDDRVADDVGVEAHFAADDVGEDDVAILGDAEADRRPLARGDPLGRLFARQSAGTSRRNVPARPAASASWRSASSCAVEQKQ